jgi:uncharacterized protein (DUF427 family)
MKTENVWDYPRPPRLEPVTELIRVTFAGVEIVRTTAAYRVLETSHPPTYYVPPSDVRMEFVKPSTRRSFCEWKGRASYFSLEWDDARVQDAGWFYEQPNPAFAPIAGYLAFYASRVEACYVGDHRVAAQPGDFYGGWVTPNLVGPFKGGPGSWGW